MVVVIQFIAPTLFPIWTHNKIDFDSWTFGALSLSVLVLAISQPAVAIIQGKNSVRAQFLVSLIGTLIAIAGMYILIPIYGIRSAACSLLAAELICLSLNVFWAKQLLKKNGLEWPWRSFRTLVASILATAAGMIAIDFFTSYLSKVFLILTLITQICIAKWYWNHLPLLVRNQAVTLIFKVKAISLIRRIIHL
ncbi:polysaccharide biosynthesis C-terminal domain-containing protein [Polynucleobacter sp. P1-05-14]|uniref:polysaccharide biosynthesis C-terminal domain-containing protein n=1 Tax=Polynucleobacter sp. P1-05-14 TaxID=1819732 RepID=UPI00351D23C6